MEIVYADDGETVWIKNLVPCMDTYRDVWVKGTLTDDGTVIRLPAGQVVSVDNSGNPTRLFLLGYEEKDGIIIPSGQIFINEIPFLVEGDEIRFAYPANKGMAVGAATYFADIESYGINFLGMSTFTFKRINQQQKAQMPAGLETKDYIFTADGIGEVVRVGIDGTDIYISGLFNDVWPFDPICIKGTFDGRKAVFPDGQLLFLQNGEWNYMKTVDGGDLTLTYDKAADTFTPDGSIMCCCDRLGSVIEKSDYVRLALSRFEDKPAVPAEPKIMRFTMADNRSYSTANINFVLKDKDGNYIDKSKLTVKIYLDGQPYILTPEAYPGIEANMEEIPYGFMLTGHNGTYINTFLNMRQMLIVIPGNRYYSRIGAQTVYYGGGERHTSDIVYYENETAGIKDVTAEKTIKNVSYYTMTGCKTNAPAKGVYIKQTIYDDGTEESVKIMKK